MFPVMHKFISKDIVGESSSEMIASLIYALASVCMAIPGCLLSINCNLRIPLLSANPCEFHRC